MEPMDADDWLKSVEKKLQVVQCNNREKVLMASQQLSSPAVNWWDAYHGHLTSRRMEDQDSTQAKLNITKMERIV
jgi:hypothetical protein